MKIILPVMLLSASLLASEATENYEPHIKNLAAGKPEKDIAVSVRVLKDAGTTAFPALLAHLADSDRAASSFFPHSFKGPPTIGEACFQIIQSQVEADWISAPECAGYQALKPDNVKEWLQARQGMSLARLRREALEDSLRRAEADLAKEPSYKGYQSAVSQIRNEISVAKYGEAFEDHLPPELARYRLLPGSTSPDQKFGILYPRRSDLIDMDFDRVRLVLVRLSPIRVITDIPLGYSSLTLSGRHYYHITWTKDSSAFLMIQGTRWGPDRVYLGEMDVGKKPRLTNLAAHVARRVRPDFKKSGAEPYNEHFEFEFDDEGRTKQDDPGGITDGWQFTDDGNVKIDCTCTTDPKGFEKDRWTMNWSGVWERKNQRFTHESMKRKWPKP